VWHSWSFIRKLNQICFLLLILCYLSHIHLVSGEDTFKLFVYYGVDLILQETPQETPLQEQEVCECIQILSISCYYEKVIYSVVNKFEVHLLHWFPLFSLVHSSQRHIFIMKVIIRTNTSKQPLLVFDFQNLIFSYFLDDPAVEKVDIYSKTRCWTTLLESTGLARESIVNGMNSKEAFSQDRRL
jgi:hypothetical protein